MMSAGTAFARAASQPIVSGVRDFCIVADTSPRQQAIKQNLAFCRRFALRSAALKRLRNAPAPPSHLRNASASQEGRRLQSKITSERFRWILAAREQSFPRQEPFRPEQRLCCATWTAPLLFRRAKHRHRSEMRLPKTKLRTAQSVS